jgi:PKD repeat protein
MMGRHNTKIKLNYFLVVIASAAIVLGGIYLFLLNDFKTPDPSSVKASVELSCSDLDKIEEAKQAWGDMITHHPFYTRPHRTQEEWNKLAPTDRPDLAAELEFMKTMDPALGAVPYERLFKANQDIDKELKRRAPITGVNWVERGPTNIGGRTRAIMFDPNDGLHKKVWAGGVGGGLWFTNDITAATPVWNKVNDLWDNIAITTIACNPTNGQEFYVGTGEGFENIGAQSGSGIWKSSNGGSTWAVLPATVPGAWNSASDFQYVQKIVVKSNGTILAATRGYFINHGGIMRSINGGTSWSKVLTVYTGVGTLYDWACDVEIGPNGDAYASFGIGSEGKVYKSKNANDGALLTWYDKSASVVIGNAQRIELACAPSDFHVIYAVAHGGSGNNDIEWLKRSVDSGATWTALAIPRILDDNTTHFTVGQAWYNLILAVHPSNSNYVLAGGRDLFRTTNGGTAWSQISDRNGGFTLPYVHADQHGIAFRPTVSDEVVFSLDGGIYYSTNAGLAGSTPTFASKNNGYNITQFYACAAKNEYNSNFFLAGAQDNYTLKFTVPQAGATSLVIGGDGGFCHIDQLDGDFQMGAQTYSDIFRSRNGGYNFIEIINDNTGLFINPSDYDNTRKILYMSAANDVVKRVSGIDGAVTNTNIAISVGAAMISALKVSPYNDVVFLGISNSRVYKLSAASTGAPSLTRIDIGSTPITSTGWVSNIDVGADDSHLIVSYSNYGVVSIWQTIDGGTTWFSKEGNISDIPVRWVIYNPDNRNQAMAATELGVWTTDNFQPTGNGAPTWGESNTGLAHTRCDMLKYRSADKIVTVATHGRGLYTTDVFVPVPVADFIADANASCSGSLTVHFTDTSLKPNGTWAWDVDNNGVTDYTTRNCIHTYNTPGAYSVKLTVNAGATSVTKQNFITVLSSAPTISTGCTVPGNINNGNNAAIGIYHFAVGSIDNYTPYDDGSYHDYTCSKATSFNLNTMYNTTIQTGYLNIEGAIYYIDYNDNGTFEGGEGIVTFPANTDGTRTLSFTTPASGVVTHKALRSRIISRVNGIPSGPCDVGSYGQAEEYTVYINCTLSVTLSSGTAAGSLPYAINCANSGDTVKISASLANQTINIGSSPIVINKNLVIMALGANTNITSSAAGVFDISTGKTVELKDLIVTAGDMTPYGAINNNGIFKMNNVNIHRNAAHPGVILVKNNPGATCNMFGMSFIWN